MWCIWDFNHDASALVALGLHALQHRGQEGCGIVSFDGKNYHSEKRQGLVGRRPLLILKH